MFRLQMLAVVFTVFLCHQSSAFYFKYYGLHGPYNSRLAQCSSASKPCRVKATYEMESGDPDTPNSSETISTHVCSCRQSSSCSSDWEGDRDHVITRELRTNGMINMTFSMMFCRPVARSDYCSRNQVAIQLKGMGLVPTEVDFIQCTCVDPRPLVLHRTFTGDDYLNYHAFVCPNHKRRCNLRWNRDICMLVDPDSSSVTYPCKCTNGTICISTSNDEEYTCRSP